MADLLLVNARIVSATGTLVNGGLRARDGVVVELFEGSPPPVDPDAETIDAQGRFVLPGLIDPHVQLYPSEDWGHYASETGSAALGGVTTILKMHRDLDGYDAETVWAEVEAAEKRARVDFGFHLMVMSDEQIQAIPRFAAEFELTSFKVLLAYKGQEGYRIGIQGVDDRQLLEVFEHVSALGGVALVHCENQELANRALAQVRSEGRDDLRAFADSRPWWVEVEAINRAVLLSSLAACPLYVVHVTSRQGVEALVKARSDGAELFIETEPHYLTETCDSSIGNLGKVLPPIREAADGAALWRAVETGELDSIGSDHVSATRARKVGSIWDAQLAFPGIATILPVLLSEGVHARGVPLARIVELTSTNPARIFGLEQKGDLSPGCDADFVIVDLDETRVVDAARLGSSSDFSIYEGRELRGWPVMTVSRGVVVMRDGALVGSEGHGRYLRRSPTDAGRGLAARDEVFVAAKPA